MSDGGITRENLLRIMPPALVRDPSIMALAQAAGAALEARLAQIDRVRVISNIDGLDEPLLDILAYDFKVDWWDPNYTLAEKRRTLKDSWRVHKKLGTRYAVETALRAIYPATDVKEWFEYEGGRPYHFKISVDMSGMPCDETRPWRVMEKANYYKSLRSHLDRIEFTIRPRGPYVLRVGGAAACQFRLALAERADRWDLRGPLRLGGASAVQTRLPVREHTVTALSARLRAAGRGTVRAVLPVAEFNSGR